MGLFEAPFADRLFQEHIKSDSHLDLAETAVEESLVLLRNRDSTLPVDHGVQHIHITWRFAEDIRAQSGGWTIEWQGIGGNAPRERVYDWRSNKEHPGGSR